MRWRSPETIEFSALRFTELDADRCRRAQKRGGQRARGEFDIPYAPRLRDLQLALNSSCGILAGSSVASKESWLILSRMRYPGPFIFRMCVSVIPSEAQQTRLQ